MRYRTAFLAGAAAGVVLIAINATMAATPAASTISIDNFVFNPVDVTVASGSTVTWTNSDDIPHKIVANDGSFKSKLLDTDNSFSMVFDKPGTYAYFCSLHPRMVGKIVVTEGR